MECHFGNLGSIKTHDGQCLKNWKAQRGTEIENYFGRVQHECVNDRFQKKTISDGAILINL